MRKLMILTGLAVVALAAAGTAGATAPTTTTTSFHRSIPNYLPCPGFVVHGEFDINRTTTTFYDNAGTATRTVSHIRSDGTLSNPLTGKSVPDSGDFNVTVDLTTGERLMDGNVSTATVPGEGVVYHSVGRLVFDPQGNLVFEAGPHDDADGTYGALCSYLAGP